MSRDDWTASWLWDPGLAEMEWALEDEAFWTRFRCPLCVQCDEPPHMGHQIWLTGQWRETRVGARFWAPSEWDWEFICEDCGYLGWSNHPQLERKFEALCEMGRRAQKSEGIL